MAPAHLSASQDGSPGGTLDGPSAVSLADVLDREVPLHWYEAVAVVGGLCAALVEQQMSGVPRPEAVSLTREGRIAVDARARLLETAALPRLLHGLLTTAEPPAPLRLFVLHAMAPDQETSIGGFAHSLDYYERPGREELVQAVYQRVLETPAHSPSETSRRLLLDGVASESQPKPQAGRSRSWVLAVVLLVFAACTVTYGIAASSRAGARASAEPTGAATIVEEIEEAARAVTSVVRERLAAAVGRLSAPAPAPPRAVEPARSPRTAAPRRSRRGMPAPPPQAAAIDVGASVEIAEDAVPADKDLSHEPVEPELLAFPFATADGSIIYSSTAQDVTPPTLRDPHRLPDSLQVADESLANAIEVVISEDGVVERVTMVGRSTQFTDMMLLGAAKTWKFDPATREGVPVKYRLRLDRAETAK